MHDLDELADGGRVEEVQTEHAFEVDGVASEGVDVEARVFVASTAMAGCRSERSARSRR